MVAIGCGPTDNSDEISDLPLLNEVEVLPRILGGGTGSGVMTIAEEVDVDTGNSEFFRGPEESKEKVNVRMDVTIGDLQEYK